MACYECGHAESKHGSGGCTGGDGMRCDCPGWRRTLPGGKPAPYLCNADGSRSKPPGLPDARDILARLVAAHDAGAPNSFASALADARTLLAAPTRRTP